MSTGTCVGIAVTALLIYFTIRHRTTMAKAERAVMSWLSANPGWHYVPEIREAVSASRSTIYTLLPEMEERGLLEAKDAEESYPGSGLRRSVYRCRTRGDQ